MHSSLPWQAFTAVRSLVVASAFVGLWAWLAVSVRRFDGAFGFAIPASLQPVGLVVAVAGALITAWCVAVFAIRGRGTPAPFDPPRDFVASGPYRFVRNPMYVGAIATLAGAGLAVGSPSIAALAAVFFVLAHLFVLLYEEPTLTEKFGDGYLRYKSTVRRWLPGRPGTG